MYTEEAAAVAERAAVLEAARIIQDELECASGRVLGSAHADVWRHPKEAVRLARRAEFGADLFCRAPATLWRRLASYRSREVSDGLVVVRTVSEFGLQQESHYSSGT